MRRATVSDAGRAHRTREHGRPYLQDGAPQQRVRGPARHVDDGRRGARRLPCHGDPGGIPPKLRDVLRRPLEGHLLVQDPCVSGGAVAAPVAQKSVGTQSIVDGDHHHALGRRQLRAVVEIFSDPVDGDAEEEAEE